MKATEVPSEVMKEINVVAEKLCKIFSPDDVRTYTCSPIGVYHSGSYDEGMSIEFQLGKGFSGTYTYDFLNDCADRLHATDWEIFFKKDKFYVRFKVFYSEDMRKGRGMMFTERERNQLWMAMVHYIAACKEAGFTLEDLPTCAALVQRLKPEK